MALAGEESAISSTETAQLLQSADHLGSRAASPMIQADEDLRRSAS